MNQRRESTDYVSRKSRVGVPKDQRTLNSRRTLLLLFVLMSVGGTLAYSGSSALLVIYRLIVDGVWLLLWLAAAGSLGFACLRWVFVPCDQSGVETPGKTGMALLIAVTSIALGLGMISLIVLGLGLLGWLNRTSGIVLLVAALFLGAIRWGKSANSIMVGISDGLKIEPGVEWLWLFAAPFLSIALIGVMLPPGILWTHFRDGEPHGYDVVEYHLQVPREWFEAGRIMPLHHNVFSFFPFNVEMHYLLAMHLQGGPWAGMYLAQLMHLTLMVLCVLAVYAIAARVGSRTSAIMAALAAATVPWMTQLGAIAYDEGGFLLFGTLAMGWALLAIVESKAVSRRFALAGAMAGLACGVKLTAVPEVLIAVALAAGIVKYFCLRDAGDEVKPRRFAGIGLFLLIGIVFFGPWLARNTAWAGNPVFPEATRLLGRGHFSPVQQERWERAHAPRDDQRNFRVRFGELRRQVLSSWQYGYLIFPLSLVGIVWGYRSPVTWFLSLMLIFLLIFWIGFTHLEGRFFILAVPICALLVARIDWRPAVLPGIGLVLVGAGIGWTTLHRGILAYLNGGPGTPMQIGMNPFLGVETFWPMQDLNEKIPADATVVLVGDARAFWYPFPMTRLRYRTVFDVDVRNGQDLVRAWDGTKPLSGDTWLQVDSAELRRFHKTYWGIPAPPDWIDGQGKAGATPAPFLIRENELPQ